MKNSKKKKLLSIVFIFLFVFYFTIYDVSAADKKNSSDKKEEIIECSSAWSNDQLINLYGIKAINDENYKGSSEKQYKYKLEMKPSKKTTVSFKISAKKGSVSKNTIKKGQSVDIITNNDGEFKIELSAEVSAKNEELQLDNKKCKGTITIEYTTSTSKGKADKEDNVVIDAKYNLLAVSDEAKKPLNCDGNNTDKGEQLICSARNALGANDSNTNFNSVSEKKYKCDANAFLDYTKLTDSEFYAKDSEYKDALKTGKYYYVNRQYQYAWKWSDDKSNNDDNKYTRTLKFNFDPGKEATTKDISCKVKCEEGVAVEYGPPIASKAGLCFEYKVRVTSAVRCYVDSISNPPDNKYNYCTPAPVCTGIGRSGTQYFVRQGGPSEEYDQCIKSCDGGKYTKTCSNKCYKKIYGGSSSKTINNGVNYSTQKLNSLSTCKKLNDDGCYYTSGGTILWSPGSSYAGRWYSKNNRAPGSDYTPFSDGFYRHNYGGGEYCHDTCWWQMEECSGGNYYLNPKIAEEDYKANVEEYNKLVKACTGAASCSTKTAEFTMSVDYSTGKEKKTINFPASGVDKIPTNSVDSKKPTTVTVINDPEPQGCYKSGDTNSKFYQVAWSFPGSWINNKTGEVSYIKKSSDSGWRELPDKFCIPLNASNVNQTWWNSYYGKIFSDKKYSNKTSTFSEEGKANCETNSTTNSIYKYKQSYNKNDGDITYNIHAQTKEFGYFGWKINVSCFYALNTNPVKIEESKDDDSTTSVQCKTSNEVKVRAVDLTNLFPATDGSPTKDSSKAGRTPGFNWSTYATITSAKNSGYTSSPTAYLAEVQNLGYSIYSNDYLDYEFELDKNKLSELKKKSGVNNNYTIYNGKFRTGEKSGVSRYTSDIISQYATKVSRKGRTNSGESLDCNNVVNYNSEQCKKVGEIS